MITRKYNHADNNDGDLLIVQGGNPQIIHIDWDFRDKGELYGVLIGFDDTESEELTSYQFKLAWPQVDPPEGYKFAQAVIQSNGIVRHIHVKVEKPLRIEPTLRKLDWDALEKLWVAHRRFYEGLDDEVLVASKDVPAMFRRFLEKSSITTDLYFEV